MESLSKRYTLRRLDTLDIDSDSPRGSEVSIRTQEIIVKILSIAENRMQKITNIAELKREDFDKVEVGTTPLLNLTAILMNGSKSATLVVNDRGNIDRVFKALKHAFPHCGCTIIARERVEVRIPRITAELREARGELAEKCVNEAKKDLKRSELLMYKELKNSQNGKHPNISAELVNKIKTEYSTANALLDDLLRDAIDQLGLE